jgi:hypothetical protein
LGGSILGFVPLNSRLTNFVRVVACPDQSPGKYIPEKIVYSPGIIAARARSGCLLHEKDYSVHGLDFTDIHSHYYFCVSDCEFHPRRVSAANKLKVYEKQTEPNQGRLRFVSES